MAPNKKGADLIAAAAAVPVTATAALPRFEGEVFRREGGGHDYEARRYQYAFSSHFHEGGMDPAAIIYPKHPNADGDVRAAIKYAFDNSLAVAVRTGGHQYSGASSTAGRNIQLDLSRAYTDFEWNAAHDEVRVGVSFGLAELNAKLGATGHFVPHGQCSHVHVGGHAHTGGYGQLTRAFGLFGDHITAIRVITADGRIREIARGSGDGDDRDLFWAVLGGSPGNFGVLTHVTLRPHSDKDHPNSRGLKLLSLYNKDRLKKLLDIKADMASDDALPADIDFCVTVVSAGQQILPWYGVDNIDVHMRTLHKEEYGNVDVPLQPPAIMLYVQWANLKGDDETYETSTAKAWFDSIKKAAGTFLDIPIVRDEVHTPMSQLTKAWVYQNVREFETPYVKRTFVTKSTTLNQDGWAAYTADRIDALQSDLTNGCNLAVQIQHMGGSLSQFRNNDSGPNAATAYSWRDSTVVCILDAFYDPRDLLAVGARRDPRAIAERWQAENDAGLKGPAGNFSRGYDRRVLWGSYHATLEEKNMAVAWPFYHESRDKYARLCNLKLKFDPAGVFTPNEFCVGVAAPPTSSVDLAATDAEFAAELKCRRLG